MLNGYRKNDVVILVCQNNALKRIEMGRINAAAEALLGYSADALEGKPFMAILPQRVAEILQDHVEFGVSEYDVSNVIAKIPNFQISDKNGVEHTCRIQAIPAQVIDGNPWFHLLLQPASNSKAQENWRDLLAQSFKTHELISDKTGMPNRESLIRDVQLVHQHSAQSKVDACFALIEIANYSQVLDWHGPRAGLALHQVVARICRQKLRSYDVVGSVSESVLGLVMLDVKPETTRVVLNRIRWEMMANPVMVPKHGMVQLELRIAFTEINDASAETLIEQCEKSLLNPDESALTTSLIHQLGAAV